MADPSPGVAADASDLTEAEREVRQAVPDSYGETTAPDWAIQRVLAEYDRRGAELERRKVELEHIHEAYGRRPDEVKQFRAENADLRAEVERLHEAAAQALANQTKLKGMSVEDGAMLLELDSPRELVIPWVWAARHLLGDAPNYSETRIDFPTAAASMEVKAAGEVERFVLTVQRAGKVTPHEARRAAEAEVAWLRSAVTALADGWVADLSQEPFDDHGRIVHAVTKDHAREVRETLGETQP